MKLFSYSLLLLSVSDLLLIYNRSNSFVIAADPSSSSNHNSHQTPFVDEWDYEYELQRQASRNTAAPRIAPVFKSPDPLHVGCYDAWYKNSLSYRYTAWSELNSMQNCVDICDSAPEGFESSFVLLKGKYCVCMRWDNFTNARVQDSFCDVKCDGDVGTSCGGHQQFSVYCKGDNCTEFQIPPISELYKLKSGQATRSEIDPVYSCVRCADLLTSCIQSTITPAYDYIPEMSAKDCIDYCKKAITYYNTRGEEIAREPTKYALAGWDQRYGQTDWLEISVCKCSDTIFDHFAIVGADNCTNQCFDDNRALCGGTVKGTFTAYCSDVNGCQLEVEPTTPMPAPETTTEAVATSKLPPTTPNYLPTDEMTANPTLVPTDGITSKPTLVPTDGITTENLTPTDFPTNKPPATTATTTTTTEKPNKCSPQCTGYDSYGKQWTCCPGKLCTEDCPNGIARAEKAKWYCKPSGVFDGDHPDLSQCRTEWVGQIGEQLGESDDPIPPINANNFLNQIEIEMKDHSYFGHEITKILGYVDQIFKRLPPSEVSPDQFKKLTNKSMDIGNEVLANGNPWTQIPQTNRSQTTTKLFSVIEGNLFDMMKNLAPIGTESPTTFARNKFNAGVGGGQKSVIEEQTLTYPFHRPSSDSNRIELPPGWANTIEGDSAYYQGISMSREAVQNLLPNSQGFEANRTSTSFTTMNTNLIGFTLVGSAAAGADAHKSIEFPGSSRVTITLRHEVEAWGDDVKTLHRKLHHGEKVKVAKGSARCVFWDTKKLEWSSEGCSLVTTDRFTTVCQCSHLTNFAVLFDTHNYSSKELGLELLTIILCALSVLCLFTTIVIFTILRSTHSSRTTITKNLAICLLVGNSLVLLVMDRHYFDMSEGVCTASAIIIHYAFLSAFMWMGIEGFYLYKLMIHVFDHGGSNHLIMYRIFGYGIPLVIVGLTGTVGFLTGEDAYGGDVFCWLQGNYIWAFLAPAAIVIIGNSIILFITLRTAYQVKTATAQLQDRVTSYRTWARGCISLSVLLGLTWTIGFLITIDSFSGSVVFSYLFTILNGSQGILLFTFHCLLNEKVSAAAARRNINLPSWLSGSVSKSGEGNNTPSNMASGSRRRENLKTVFADPQEQKRQTSMINKNPADSLKQDGIPQARRRSNTMKDKDMAVQKVKSTHASDPTPASDVNYHGTVSSVDSYRTSTTDMNLSGNDSSSGGGSQKNLIIEKRKSRP